MFGYRYILWCDLETTFVLLPVVYMCINKIVLPVTSPTTKPPHLTWWQWWDFQNKDSLLCLQLQKVEYM